MKIIIKLFILFILLAGFGYFLYLHNINSSAATEKKDTQFTIQKGENLDQISQRLSAENIIKSNFFFKLYLKLNNQQNQIKAGEYLISPGMNIKEISELLIKGDTISRERDIKIIEGWNIKDINNYLVKNSIVQGDDFISAANNNYEAWNFLGDKPQKADLEGYLFPDTYRIYIDAGAEEIIQKMLANFDQKIDQQMRDDILRQNKTIYEILTMASIVEKEVRIESDMKTVAGIFWNRISNGHPLESCATLAYILGINKPQYSLEDTKIDNPYNTYQNFGLPPGPICNPGISAIKAAIYPQETDYYYFLNRPDTGETIFSRNYNEHLRNKAKYLD